MTKHRKLKLKFGCAVGALAIISAIGINNCFAETSGKTNVSVEVKQGCNVTAKNNEHISSISNGTYSEIGDPTEFTIACNGNNKYDIYAVGFINDTEGNNKLVGDKDSDNKYNIATGTAQSGDISNWAFKLSEPSEGLTLEPTYSSDFTSIPGQSEKVASRAASTLNNTKDTFKSTYAAYISKSQPADTYHGKVKYTLMDQGATPITNYSITYDINGGDSASLPSPNPQTGQTMDTTITLSGTKPTRSGYEFVSWCSTNPGASDTCPASAKSYTVGGSYTLSDGAIAKLYAVWKSSENSTASFRCSSLSTGGTSTITDDRDGNTYTVAKLNDDKCWMTQNLRLGDSKLKSHTLTTKDTDLHSGTYILPNSNVNGFSDSDGSIDNIYVGDNETYGGYYTWAAATAGTNPSSGEASSSICPKGWRLPTYAEFRTLISIYNITTIQQPPANFALAGIYYGSTPVNIGMMGYWWSSTTYSSTYVYNFYMFPDVGLFETEEYYKWYAYSIRCVSRQ